MNLIYEVRSTSRSDSKTHYWGARHSKQEAKKLMSDRTTGEREKWARQYHKAWWIEEINTTGMFKIPSQPPPRERFTAKTTLVESPEGFSSTLKVEILGPSEEIVSRYCRNHPGMYQTFEPFRQGSKMFALISTDYTATSVINLESGEVVASEKPDSGGFCPIGFYVPDWWDIHDGSILPGSHSWRDDHEEPRGEFGFVWGCIWGDDTTWKIQYLDLSQIQSGKIFRDDRFGYIELPDHQNLSVKDCIECHFYGGRCNVTFTLLATYDLKNGLREECAY